MKKLYTAIITALIATQICGCSDSHNYITSDGAMLGTTFHVCTDVLGLTPTELYNEMMRIDSEAKSSLSIFNPESLLSRINRGETDSLNHHLLYNLTLARTLGEKYDTRYDVTVKPLTDAWGFAAKNADKNPNIDSLLHFVGYDKWAIDGCRVVRHDPRVQFDLNSIAKGYTVDMVAEMVESHGAQNYIVEVGGEIRCRGVNPKGNTWRVGIDTPSDGNISPGQNLATAVKLNDKALATSGNYRRFYIDASGRKVVHTLDPRSGHSTISRLLSATVITNNCATADALATMFMAVGEERAIELAEMMRDSVKVCFIIDKDGDRYDIFSTLE